MNIPVIFRTSLFLLVAASLSGCFGSGSKSEPSICQLLEENEEWAQPLVLAQNKYGTPLSLTLVLLEQPLSELDKQHIQPRSADWDEYRIRSENWGASQKSPYDAVDFIGWFSRESLKRNKISWNDVSAHYLSYRLGHGAYHRFEPEKYPELVQQAERIEQKSNLWQQQLKNCKPQLQEKSWFSKLKFW
ncbi:MAG: hypothetical protein ACPF9K_14030 [Neptuniibacter sp.]